MASVASFAKTVKLAQLRLLGRTWPRGSNGSLSRELFLPRELERFPFAREHAFRRARCDSTDQRADWVGSAASSLTNKKSGQFSPLDHTTTSRRLRNGELGLCTSIS